MSATATRRWLPWLAVVVVALGFANFLAFFIVSAALGGDALDGHVTDGHYYLANHGADTEVSQLVWAASRTHAVVTMLSWPVVMLAMAFLLLRYGLPFLMTGNTPGRSAERVAAIQASGVPMWKGWPGGVAGGVQATMGMLGAVVYPGGIVVTPRFMSPSAIRADEIRSVRFGRRLVTPTIEVEHAGADIASPLVLYGSPDSPQAHALLSLASGDSAIAPSPAPASGGGRTPASTPAGPTPVRATVPGPMRALSLLGLAVAVVMIVSGIFFVIPSLGMFGVVWTGMLVLILVINVRRFIRRGW